jgi:protein-tyrosine phosphatase
MNEGSANAIRHLLVVCEGNHCRGPMAEALLRSQLPPDITVESAGLAALEGAPADLEAQRLMADIGMDISTHVGRQLTYEMTVAADLILVMELSQKTWCGQMFPSSLGRIFLLGHWQPPASREIQDPFRQGSEAFRVAFESVRQSASDWPPRLTSKQRSA